MLLRERLRALTLPPRLPLCQRCCDVSWAEQQRGPLARHLVSRPRPARASQRSLDARAEKEAEMDL